MAEANWFEKIIGSNNPAQQEFYNNIGFNVKQSFTTPKYRKDSARTVRDRKVELGREDSRMAALNPNAPTVGPAALRDPADTGEKARFGRMESQMAPQTQLEAPPTRSGNSSGGGGSGLDKVFAPLFAALDQQRANADSRYTENSGQITNIYGQLIGARTDDVDSINTAYERLQAAAASRGAETMSGMAGREDSRVSQNQAVLGSMGVGDLGTAGNDVASAGAQAAQNTEAANQSNYAGMLDMMNATSQDIARADATSFGYRQGEDIARLQGSREDFLQGVDQQDFNLQSQQIQAEQAYQQAQAAAAASAAAASQKADAKAIADAEKMSREQQAAFLQNADPLTKILVTGGASQILSAQDITNMQSIYDGFMGSANNGELYAIPSYGWDKFSLADAFRTSKFAEGMSLTQKNLVAAAVRDSI
jgi:hypothetical protein